MQQEEITIQSLANRGQINIDYSDDDLMIIDNIKLLVEPSATRVKMNFIAICMRGRVQMAMNGQMITISENQLLFCPPNVTFSDFMFSHDVEFKALFMTNRLLQSFLREKMTVWNEVMYVYKMHVMSLEEKDIQFLSRFYDILRLCIDTRTDNPYRSEIVQSLVRGALLGLCGSLRQLLPKTTPPQLRHSGTLFQHFLDLLGSTTTKHQTVEQYADELCVSAKYLSAVCKKSSGKTANEWITEHVIEDIRYYLRSTDLSVKQICSQLGFPNPSFFGKYVKEHFGLTPRQLREQQG